MSLEWVKNELAAMRARIDAAASMVSDFTTYAKTSADGSRDEANVTAQETQKQRPMLRTSPWGVATRPVVGVACALVKAYGGPFGAMLVGVYTNDYGPQNLDEGEVCLYCSSSGTRVYLDKDGNVKIDAASSQNIVLNGGTLQIARSTDPVKVTIPPATVIVAVAGGTLNADPIVLDGTIQSGAENALA
jgi:phage gp45-like